MIEYHYANKPVYENNKSQIAFEIFDLNLWLWFIEIDYTQV